MTESMDGLAVVWCEGAFGTPYGKTAHGLVRFTRRYEVVAVIDSTHAGRDAGDVLDGRPCGIPVVADLAAALDVGAARTLVIGIAPDGGRLTGADRAAVVHALERGLNVDSGLHDFLGDDPALVAIAARTGARLRDVRRPPPVAALHAFSGRIDSVGALRLAVLGTDSAVGKRTTAVMLTRALTERGVKAEMIGTGQTAWMQGVRYQIVLDSLINDFIAGELENAVLRAWDEQRPEVIVVEGQGSLMNPAYPGGYEILAATRPHGVVMQHAPRRTEYDGFPGYALHPLATQIAALELVSGRKVVAIAINHEGLTESETHGEVSRIGAETGLPCCAPLIDGVGPILDAVLATPREPARTP